MGIPAESDPRRVGTIWMLNLDEPVPLITPRIAATFRRAEVESAPALAEAMRNGSLQQEVLSRFETGRHCYTAWVQEQLAAYGWVSFDEEFVGELNLRLQLLPGEAYIWDCATAPLFRRNLLFSALLAYISSALHEESLCRAWIGANQENVASQRGFARAGFQCVADLFITHIATQRLAWIQGRPGMPEDLVAEARRVYLGRRDPEGLAVLP